MTALKNEWFMFAEMAFRSRKVFGTFEKGEPGHRNYSATDGVLPGVLARRVVK